MLDIGFIREHKDVVAMGAKKKHISFDVEELLKVDDKRKELLQKVEDKKAKQNEVSKQIQQATPEERTSLIEEMQSLKTILQEEEEQLREVMKEWRALMLQVPNIPDMSVPEGKDDSENIEIREVGEIPKFNFTPKSHVDLLKERNMVDFERGTKIAGFRGYILKNEAAILNLALWQFAMDVLSKKGFETMIVPSLVRKETLYGTGYLPQGEEDMYKTQDDYYLAGTGEVATMNYYADEVVDFSNGPIKMAAISPCFRREAGSHGKDTRGLIRVHEFMKVEQVILCEASHEESVRIHEELLANAEEIMQKLEIPYHVINVCGGDLGLGQVKKFDIEAWVPSEKTYRETHSASYFHDFQTRRLNIKYVDGNGKRKFAHSLNNTAIATPRLLVPFIENHQQEDGTIRIPEALRPYIGGRETL